MTIGHVLKLKNKVSPTNQRPPTPPLNQRKTPRTSDFSRRKSLNCSHL